MCLYCKNIPERKTWYVGMTPQYDVWSFSSLSKPTRASHPHFKKVFGPFKAKKYAEQFEEYMRKDNPERAWHAERETSYHMFEERARAEGRTDLADYFKGKRMAHHESVEEEDRRKRDKNNPPRPAVKIYDRIEEIRATKGTKSLWPQQKFKHKFTSKDAAIYGLEDGSLMVKSKSGKKLWKNFTGYIEGVDYP